MSSNGFLLHEILQWGFPLKCFPNCTAQASIPARWGRSFKQVEQHVSKPVLCSQCYLCSFFQWLWNTKCTSSLGSKDSGPPQPEKCPTSWVTKPKSKSLLLILLVAPGLFASLLCRGLTWTRSCSQSCDLVVMMLLWYVGKQSLNPFGVSRLKILAFYVLAKCSNHLGKRWAHRPPL